MRWYSSLIWSFRSANASSSLFPNAEKGRTRVNIPSCAARAVARKKTPAGAIERLKRIPLCSQSIAGI